MGGISCGHPYYGGLWRCSCIHGANPSSQGNFWTRSGYPLYSLRKRSRLARWGRMSDWMEFHIFTGLVGPYMVLLHTSWKFNGLAGVITLFTIVIVISGFIGRYIYTRIPRTADGIEIESGLSEEAVKQARRLMALWHTIHIPLGIMLFVAAFVHIGGAIYYALLLR